MSEEKLLLVDDEEDTCASLSDILSEFGYAVDCACRASQALQLAEQNCYRLALLDFRLPCMTGVELFQRLRESRPELEALLVTAYASSETEEAASRAGMRQVVSKPVDVPTLLAAIQEVVG